MEIWDVVLEGEYGRYVWHKQQLTGSASLASIIATYAKSPAARWLVFTPDEIETRFRAAYSNSVLYAEGLGPEEQLRLLTLPLLREAQVEYLNAVTIPGEDPDLSLEESDDHRFALQI
jgi:hypothetical protein